MKRTRIVREGFWIAGSQVTAALAALVGVRALTTLLSPETYGRFSLLLTLSMLCVSTLCGPVMQAMLRFYPDAVRENRLGALLRLTAGFLLRSLAMIAALLLIIGLIGKVSRNTSILAFILAIVYLSADVYRLFESNLLNASRRQKEFAVRTAIDAWSKPALAVAAIYWFGATSVSVLGGFASASLLVSVLLLRSVVRGQPHEEEHTSNSWTAKVRPAFLAFARPLIPQAILASIVAVGDRYILDGTWGHGAVGIYAAAYGIASYPFLAGNAILISTLRPVLYDAVARADAAKERRTLWTWLGLAAAMTVVGLLILTRFARPITRLSLGPRFQDAAGLLPWVGCAYGLLSLQQCAETVLLAHGKTSRLIILQAIGAIAAIGFYFTLIPSLGAYGAAVGTLAAFLLTCLVSIPLAGLPRRLSSHRSPTP